MRVKFRYIWRNEKKKIFVIVSIREDKKEKRKNIDTREK